jgi:hypothetical protein
MAFGLPFDRRGGTSLISSLDRRMFQVAASVCPLNSVRRCQRRP